MMMYVVVLPLCREIHDHLPNPVFFRAYFMDNVTYSSYPSYCCSTWLVVLYPFCYIVGCSTRSGSIGGKETEALIVNFDNGPVSPNVE